MTMQRSFRLVCEPNQIPLVEALLQAEGFRFHNEPFSIWCRRFLDCPIPPGSSLAAIFGYIYIQDRSSMLPPLALAPKAGTTVLDMCASPGGKSGFLAQIAGKTGFVLANEPAPPRLATLRANLHKANLLQTATCSFAGEKLPLSPGTWPFILLDPPCSGWGTEKKNPSVRKLWHGQKINRLTSIQKQLLARAASLLAPGGLLLYSTCTTNADENERQTCFAEESLGLERVPLAPFPGFVFEERPGGTGCLLVAGEASDAQGFYLSLLRKPETSGTPAASEGCFVVDQPIAPASLAGNTFDPDLLPPGSVGRYGANARFIPQAAKNIIPPHFIWQAPLLGALKNKAGSYAGEFFVPDSRLRSLLPKEASRLVIDEIGRIRALLAGQTFQTGITASECGLWWRELPLGKLALKSGRAIPSFK